ncbi:RraA family protein [Rubellicoccus peritrichatus]|uniref:Putative 4-hydroxy-4-methyl-2-oxoglutarate aldolase n=1 Tax=Rubellicoccus peritrichatus TaxID=3080537 RepID=A0AAQ3QT12_9BACT|nr:RraA family protein [Puniceicoccus sp. CR14]WOO43193.1 RraA family protein [Puniceicoccus sp. CR14]
MELPKNGTERLDLCKRELYSAVIGDIMDILGYRHQFLPPQIQPLRDDMIVAGRAMPVLEADDYSANEGPGRAGSDLSQPFGLMLRALDDLQQNEVYICTGSSPTYALWGELMSTAARNQGAVGAVVNGYSRDTKGILKLNFPTFSYGRYAQDQRPRGKVIDFRCSIEMNGVRVNPGDIIFGDLDGVCVIPQEIEDEVLIKSWEKANGEKEVFEAIKDGMGAQAAWDKFGIM